jgi:hypothetical protein
MKLAFWKRALLAGLLTLSVAGGSLATFTAGDAAAGSGPPACIPVLNPPGGWDCERN